MEVDPESENAREQLKRFLQAHGREEESLPPALVPQTFEQWKARAHRALDEKRAEAAFTATEAALALDSKDFDMLMTRAGALELLASPAGVEASLLRAREVDAVRASVALSLFYLRGERFTEAAAIANAVLK